MKIENMKISDLNAAEYNARKISDKEMDKLKKSIREFGLVQPVVWNKRTNTIVGGHQRVQACKELKMDEVPVWVVDLDAKKEIALNLALNKIEGKFDKDKLRDLFESIDTGEFDLSLTGFEDSEIEKLMTVDDLFQKPEIEFTEELLEEHNYIVLYFDNTLDWQVAKERFGVKSVHALDSREGYERKGIGRVIKGADVLALLK